MAEEENTEKTAKKRRVYSRYVKDPVFLGLLVLAFLLFMATLYFASEVRQCPSAGPTGAVVTGGETAGETKGNTTRQPIETGGKIVIYEFSEFKCPYCSAAAGFNEDLIKTFKKQDPTWEPPVPKIKKEYGDRVEVVFKHFIVHDTAKKAAEAAECARDQGKFWEMHDIMFKNQAKLEVTDLKSYADEIGLDIDKFNSCLDGGKKASVVEADSAFGRQLGVSGTPTFLIGGEKGWKIVGAQPFANFKEVIDKALKGEMPESAPEKGPSIGTFQSLKLKSGICKEDGKPIVYLFSTTWCPHCKWIKDTFDSTVKEYVDAGKIVAYHWELDTKDNTLTPAVETEVPKSALEMYETFNPGGSIPTFVFGCKYYRIGNGYENSKDLASEVKDFKKVIDSLITEAAA